MAGDEQQGVEEASKFVDGQRDQTSGCGLSVAFGGGGHGQEGVGEHGQGGPAVPGGPAPDLVLIEPGEAFGGLEGFLDAPALPCDRDEGVQGDRPWCVAAQVGQLAGGIVAADQQMVPPGVGAVLGVERDPGPGVPARAVAAGAGGVLLPGPSGQQGGQAVHADRTGRGGDAPVGRHGQHIAQTVTADGGAQPRIGAVDFVAGHPRRGDLRLNGAGDHGCRQRGFSRETPPVGGDSGVIATILILGP